MLWGIKEIAEYASYGETLTRRIAAMKCYSNSAYSIIDNRTGKCAEKRGRKG